MPSWIPWDSWEWWEKLLICGGAVLGLLWAWFGHSPRFAKYDRPKEW